MHMLCKSGALAVLLRSSAAMMLLFYAFFAVQMLQTGNSMFCGHQTI